MKALILAGGYGTRLYPLTLNKPKPLLVVGTKSIAAHILDRLKDVEGLDEVLVVTNRKFAPNFEKWAREIDFEQPVKVINDGTLTNETRLGAIGDIALAIDEEDIIDDILIIGGDNLFDLDLADFVKFASSKAPGTTVAVRVVNDAEKITNYGVVKMDKAGRVVDFEEKPKRPKSNLAAMCIYYFPKERLGIIKGYMASSASKDAPGNYIAWLATNDAVYGYVYEGEWFDIGDADSYRLADRVYRERSLRKC